MWGLCFGNGSGSPSLSPSGGLYLAVMSSLVLLACGGGSVLSEDQATLQVPTELPATFTPVPISTPTLAPSPTATPRPSATPGRTAEPVPTPPLVATATTPAPTRHPHLRLPPPLRHPHLRLPPSFLHPQRRRPPPAMEWVGFCQRLPTSNTPGRSATQTTATVIM